MASQASAPTYLRSSTDNAQKCINCSFLVMMTSISDSSVTLGHRLCTPTLALAREDLFGMHILQAECNKSAACCVIRRMGLRMGQQSFVSPAAFADACDCAADVMHL